MIWATRQFGIDDWFDVQTRFEKQFMMLDGPRWMMLVTHQTAGGRNRLFVSLPSETLLASYPGFEEVAAADLPSEAGLLAGHQDAFEERFKR